MAAPTEEQRNRAAALEFIHGMGSGALATHLVADEFSGWSGLSGDIAGPDFLVGAGMLGKIFVGGLKFTILTTIAEGKQVSVRAVANGRTIIGADYENSLHYFFRFTAEGKIAFIAEYMNTQLTLEIVRPAFEEFLRRQAEETAGTSS